MTSGSLSDNAGPEISDKAEPVGDVLESIMVVSDGRLFDINSLSVYEKPDELKAGDGDFLKLKYTVSSTGNGVAENKMFIDDIVSSEYISHKQAFEQCSIPITTENRELSPFYYDELMLPYLAYNDSVTGSSVVVYIADGSYYVVTDKMETPLRYDEWRCVGDRDLLLCNKGLSDDDIVNILRSGNLSQEERIFYIGMIGLSINDNESMESVICDTDEQIPQGYYVLKDFSDYDLLGDIAYKLPCDVQVAFDNYLYRECIVILFTGTDIPYSADKPFALDADNRIVINSGSEKADYIVVGIGEDLYVS